MIPSSGSESKQDESVPGNETCSPDIDIFSC